MKIKLNLVKTMTIEEFANEYDLVMEVNERNLEIHKGLHRFYAHFERCDIQKGMFLHGSFGNGSTPEEAIQEYAKEISSQILVFNSYSKERREIRVPRLIEKE